MNAGKIVEVVEKYRSFLESHGISKVNRSKEDCAQSSNDVLEHCHWMLDEVDRFISEGRLGKAFRWLGFIQGCLWSTGSFNIYELCEHNRPS
jgi:hypothetical protein